MSIIKLFNALNERMLKKINSKISINYSSNIDHKTVNLDPIEQSKDIYTLENDEYYWDIKKSGLLLNLEISLENLNTLFETKFAVAHEDSILALVLMVNSNKNKVKKIYTISPIYSNKPTLNINEKIEIEKEGYRGILNFKIVLALMKKGYGDNPNILNEEGAILGDLYNWKILTEGESSIFPIMFFSDKKGPLWRFEFSYDDPFEDSLIENIRVDLNTAHKDFQFIDYRSEKYSERLINEIIKQCMQMIFIDLYQKDYLANDYDEMTSDSIMQAVKYMIETLDIKVDSILSIIKSFNEFFERGT